MHYTTTCLPLETTHNNSLATRNVTQRLASKTTKPAVGLTLRPLLHLLSLIAQVALDDNVGAWLWEWSAKLTGVVVHASLR
jgi:hypothetical protein